jgi:hypothetical protein
MTLAYEPSMNLALLQLILGLVLAFSCWHNLTNAAVHYRSAGDNLPQAVVLTGLVLGLVLLAGGAVEGYKVVSAPPASASGCGTSS